MVAPRNKSGRELGTRMAPDAAVIIGQDVELVHVPIERMKAQPMVGEISEILPNTCTRPRSAIRVFGTALAG